MFGKQDPLIKFMYQNSEKTTTTKDDQGKNAEWNESFKLENVQKSAENDE
jgi:uncharacterized membrane protein YkgB